MMQPTAALTWATIAVVSNGSEVHKLHLPTRALIGPWWNPRDTIGRPRLILSELIGHKYKERKIWLSVVLRCHAAPIDHRPRWSDLTEARLSPVAKTGWETAEWPSRGSEVNTLWEQDGPPRCGTPVSHKSSELYVVQLRHWGVKTWSHHNYVALQKEKNNMVIFQK